MRGIQVRSVHLPSVCFLFTAQLKATRSFCAVMLKCSEEREPNTPLQNLGPCREQRSWSLGHHGRQTPSALHCLTPDLPVFPPGATVLFLNATDLDRSREYGQESIIYSLEGSLQFRINARSGESWSVLPSALFPIHSRHNQDQPISFFPREPSFMGREKFGAISSCTEGLLLALCLEIEPRLAMCLSYSSSVFSFPSPVI